MFMKLLSNEDKVDSTCLYFNEPVYQLFIKLYLILLKSSRPTIKFKLNLILQGPIGMPGWPGQKVKNIT